ncbi:hypothetical protein FXF51_47820 [Nonomuraea sp. PA05]|uniref:hypothetical protein n=1 Tax=Nonomuraea sp. PA05 TaxID=2604466 RepID=UPI0011D490C8|nr:hypothetical protein [Nonomuraea sp. PA05]TYB54352.1 hypothetical protein FXF51_47820 [Nonomuraea sp. PA05]
MKDRDDDEFFAPVLRDPPAANGVSDTGVPGVHGAGHGEWDEDPPPANRLGLRLLTAGLLLLAGVVLAVLALLAGRPPLAVPPALVALGAAVYLIVTGVRRSRSDGGPPAFG